MKFLSPINVNTEYTLPFVDGTNGQVLTTDGNGAVYWGSVSAGATNLNALTDVELTNPTSGQILRYAIPPGGTLPVWYNWTPTFLTAESDTLSTVTSRGASTSYAVTFNGDVSIGTAADLSFGSATRQMINLWSTGYGIGVQSSTTYFRSDSGFAWFRGGVHNNTANNPGAEGVLAMRIDASSNLVVTGSTTAASFVKTGGTASQFLKADGSVDTNTYLTSFTETDTLATVTARGATTTGNITVNGEISLPSFIRLTNAGANNAYISESWGVNLNGASTHPIQVRSASLSVGYTLGGGTSYGSGNLFVSDKIGVNTTAPTKALDVVGSGIVASFGGVFSAGSFAGIHFGYSETQYGNDNYKKSAIVFERTDNHGQGGNASGKIHFLLNNIGGGSATSLAHSVMVIDTNSTATQGSARVGIGTTSPNSTLDVNGAANATSFSSTALFIANADTSGSLQPDQGSPANKIYSFRWQGGEQGYIDTDGRITFAGFKTPTGTASQFLKANGTVDSNTYLTTTSAASLYTTYDYVDDEIASVNTYVGNTFVPKTRTLTINGTSFDLSANRSWTISSADGYVSDVRLVESTLSFSGEGNAFSGSVDLSTLPFQPAGSYLTAEADTLATVTARGSSTTSSITVNGSLLIGPSGTANAYSGAATGKLYFGSQDSDSPTHYHITTNMEDYNGNYSKLDIRWYTGQRFYAHTGYGGFRFHEITTAAELFSVGKGDAHVRVANNLYVSGGTTSGDITVSGSSAGIYFTGGNNRIYFAGARAIEGNGTNLQIGEGHSQTQIQSSTTRVDGILTTAGTSINTSNGARIFGLKSESGKYFTQNAFGQDGGYTWPSTTYVTGNDNSPIGNVTFRGNGAYQGHTGPEYVPIDATKTYKVSVWIRAVSGSPFCYLSHRQYYWDYSPGNPSNGGWGNPYWWSGTPSSSWTEYSMTIGPAGSGADHTHMAGVKFIRHGWLHNYTADGSATAEFQGWKIEELDSTLANNVTVMGNAVIHAGNIGSQSVSYATSSGNSVTTSQTNFSELFIDNSAVATKEFVTSQGYITGYTEADTLATVTGRGASTSSPITINGGGSQPLSLTTSSGSPWHLALVRTDLGLTSRVFAHNSPYNCWYFEHNISIAGNTNWHSGNDGSGSGLDADLLDGVNGASFLRNDVVGAGVSGTIISTNNANVDGSNFTVDTVNKTVNEYAYKVSRSGSAVGGILIDGRGVFPSINVNGASVTSTTISNWNTAYGWGNHATASYIKADSTEPLTIQAETVTFTGSVTVEGTFTESSSIRFKENIAPLDPALDKVNQLEAVSYNKIGVDDREIGLIAEDVAELFPEVVTYNEEGQPQGIQYQRLSVILLKAVQELTERVNKLENK